jgi:flagellum-specific peptidoglycan hydrolase FlgJ
MIPLDAIARMCEAAVAVEKTSGCPAEMLVAQCAIESNWLQNAPANNALGFKSYPNEYGRQLLKTREWLTDDQAAEFAANLDGRSIIALGPALGDKKLYAITDWFATFPSLEACFAHRAERWQAGQNLAWVKAFHTTGDLPTMLRAMASGYSTSPTYADALLSVLAMQEVQDGLAKARSDFGTRTA